LSFPVNSKFSWAHVLHFPILFFFRKCEDPIRVCWREAIALKIISGFEEVVDIFQRNISTTLPGIKYHVLQPLPENILWPPWEQPADQCSQRSCTTYSKENTDLFPKNVNLKTPMVKETEGKLERVSRGVLPDVSNLLNNCKKIPATIRITPSPPGNLTSFLAEKTKPLSVVLQDYRKFPTTTGGVPLLEKLERPVGRAVTRGSIKNGCNTLSSSIPEMRDFKSPVKNLIPPLPPVPSPRSLMEASLKRLNTIALAVMSKRYSPLASVKSIYKETIYLIQDMAEGEPNTKIVKSYFESALKDVFPWFNFEEIGMGMKGEGKADKDSSIGQLSTVTPPPLPSVQCPDEQSILNEEILLEWNPFEDVYWDKSMWMDQRRCSFCQEMGDSPSEKSGRLLWSGLSDWVHVNCALWSSEVWEDEEGGLRQVHGHSHS